MNSSCEDITKVLEALAVSQPAACAIRVPGRQPLRYADLGAQIRYVRERLGGWGIGRGDIVAAVLTMRPEMAVACAAFPAAATFAPLSPTLAVDVYAELLARLRPKALVVEQGMEHPVRIAAQRLAITELALIPDPCATAGTFTLELTRRSSSLDDRAVAKPEWAYVLATSGTTGRAKLVPRSHRLTTSLAQHLGNWLQLAPSDVGCHLVPMHHSHGLNAALLVPLLRGSCVVCLPAADIEGYFKALGEDGVTWFTAPVTHQREVLRRAPGAREAIRHHRLRFARVSAGRLEPEEIERTEAEFGVPMLAGYGMTEATPVTHQPLPPRARKLDSAGLAICGEVAIVDQGRMATAPGRSGEIVVRSPLVFDGYFDDDEATDAAFIDGWMRTGDLGHFDEDGHLHVVGRLNDIVNRGGEKISLAEVDAAIQRVRGVRAAAAFGIAHQTLGEEIVAAVVKSPDAAVGASDIQEEVGSRMGATRVPRRIYFVDELPRTDVGKIRRSELPRLLRLQSSGATSETSGAPAITDASPLEAALIGLWSSVLPVGGIGLNDDFFLLGGDSLRGSELLASVKTIFGIELPIAALFGRAATISGMARAIHDMRSNRALDSQGVDDGYR